jgi:hypothetical protein
VRLAGYAIVFDSLSNDLGGWRERILPAAIRRGFNETGDVLAFYAHNPEHLLGRLSAKTLQLDVDKHGLHVVIEAPTTTLGQDVVKLMKRNDLTQMSFGFVPVKSTWSKSASGTLVSTVEDLLLYEVSIVASPAYGSTAIHPVAERVASPAPSHSMSLAEAHSRQAALMARIGKPQSAK